MQLVPTPPRSVARSVVAAGLAAGTALAVLPLWAGPATAQAAPVQLQIVGINDFHGHLDPGSGTAPSVAGVLGGAVAALRAQNPDTLFVSAGDNIGASPFISSSQLDAPTLDVLDQMGLAASAVGNHEFDRGYADLAGRVSDRADFPFLGANVVGERPALDEYTVVSTAGVRVGFIGVVTQQTASLVSPSGIAGISFSDPVAAANRVAAQLSDGDPANGEADVLVLLAHEGAARAATGTDAAAACSAIGAAADEFGAIVRGVSADVDAVLGGHTHVTVDCDLPGPTGVVRPVLEASEYGKAIDRLRLTWDPDARRVTAASGEVIALTPTSYPVDPAVEATVKAAQAQADVVGRQVIGSITADVPRAKTATGAEDRGSESLLGNFIADVQLSATDGPDEGGAQIAFMNPGGLRSDLLRATGTEAVGDISYAEAAVVQPFANTLFTLTLTGAQVKQVLEEQYQPATSTRPFLALGVSKGFRYGFDDSAPKGSRIHSITLNGAPILPTATYRVVTNSFLASGGDNFATLGQGTQRRDTGLDDLSVLVGYFRANSPITPDTADRAVPGPAPVTPPPTTTPTTPPTTTPTTPPTTTPTTPPLTTSSTPPLTGQTTAPPPLADLPGTKRLAGNDRYATAAAVAQDSFPAGPVPVVYVTTGEGAADALAAGPAADVSGGPVLLVGRDAVPSATRAELTRLRPQRIVVLGGTAAVSDAVVTALQTSTTGTVTRQAGADRYATAALVATTAFPAPVARVLLATGAGSADALAAGAAGARTDSPVLLTTRDRLPASTVAALVSLRPRDITVVGGPAAVSDALLAQLGAYAVGGSVVRAGGADRYATAARLAELVWPTTVPVVYLATGREPWDALTGVPAAGRDGAPVLLVEPTCMPAASKRQLDRLQPTTVVVLGGERAVSARAASGAAC